MKLCQILPHLIQININSHITAGDNDVIYNDRIITERVASTNK